MFVAHYALFISHFPRARARAQAQYQFVYETLLEYTRGIDSRFPVNVLAEKIKERGIKDKKTKKNAYQLEFLVRAAGDRQGLGGRADTPKPIHHVSLIAVQGDFAVVLLDPGIAHQTRWSVNA